MAIYSPFEYKEVEIYGKAAAPNDVENFQMVVQGSKAFFSWDPVSDLDVKYYWLRYSKNTSAIWGESTTIEKYIPGTTTSYFGPLSSGRYLIKAVDSSGNESTNATGITSSFADILDLNAVLTETESPNFGSDTSDTGINDENTVNIYFSDNNNAIKLAGSCLEHGNHTAKYPPYDNSAYYVDNMIVDYNGTLYIASIDSGAPEYSAGQFTAKLPTDTDYWALYTTAVLRDTTADFTVLDTYVGYDGITVRNLEDMSETTVVSGGVSATVLELSSDIFSDGDRYEIEGYLNSGTATSTSSNELVDSGASFDSSLVTNKLIRNTTDDTTAAITAVSSDGTTLTLSNDIFVSGEGYRIENHVSEKGFYYFQDQYIDLGAVYTSRIKANFASTSSEVTDLFDAAQGNFDAKSGKFDGSDISSTNAEVQISFTEDNPLDSDVSWSNWATFFIGDYQARGLRFRLKLTSTNESQNISVNDLSVEIDMPDTNYSDFNVTTNSGTNSSIRVITYPKPYKQSDPSIQITFAGDTGDYFTLSSTSSSGFTIQFFNSVGTEIQRSFNWLATGY